MRLRSGILAQSRQGVSDFASMRRAGAAARPQWPAALSRHPQIVMKDNGFRRAGNAAELCAIVRDAARDGRKLAITGGGTKAEIGGPEPEVDRLSMDAFSGIIDYDPAELVITAGAATPLD